MSEQEKEILYDLLNKKILEFQNEPTYDSEIVNSLINDSCMLCHNLLLMIPITEEATAFFRQK